MFETFSRFVLRISPMTTGKQIDLYQSALTVLRTSKATVTICPACSASQHYMNEHYLLVSVHFETPKQWIVVYFRTRTNRSKFRHQ